MRIGREPANGLVDQALDGLAALRRGIGRQDDDRAVLLGDRHDTVQTSGLLGDEVRDLGVEFDRLGVAGDDTPHLGNDGGEIVSTHLEASEHDVRELQCIAVRLLQRGRQVLGGELLAIDEKLPHLHALGGMQPRLGRGLLARHDRGCAVATRPSCVVLLEECHVPVPRSAVFRSLSPLVRRERAFGLERLLTCGIGAREARVERHRRNAEAPCADGGRGASRGFGDRGGRAG